VTSALVRTTLAIVALLAGAWLVLGVRALDLEADATTAGSRTLTPDEVRGAQDSLQRARLLSVDKEPLLKEGLLLFAAGRREEGLALLERVVAEEPDNLDAWVALYPVYSASGDPRRAAQALRRVSSLNPLVGDALREARR
jgi:tetratricopeptide (TPR) repeat protein